MPLNDTERALLLACHSAVVQLRSRATIASPAEVAKVTDAVELVLIELCQGRADADALLLQSELGSIAHAFPDYDGRRLFALDTADEQQRQRALFKQSLHRAVGEIPPGPKPASTGLMTTRWRIIESDWSRRSPRATRTWRGSLAESPHSFIA